MKKLTEKQLIQIIMANLTDSTRDSIDKRIHALGELEQKEIKNPVAVTIVLLEFAEILGLKKPEGDILVKILTTLIINNDDCFEKFKNKLEDKNENDELYFCASKIIKNFNSSKKKDIASILLEGLWIRRTENHTINAILKSLNLITELDIKKMIIDKTIPFLNSANYSQVYCANWITTRIGGNEVMPMLLIVLDRASNGWYAPKATEIQTDIFKYFESNSNEKAALKLVNMLKTNYGKEISSAIKSNATKTVTDKLLDIIEEHSERMYESNPVNHYELVQSILYIFKEINHEIIDVKRLLAFKNIIGSSFDSIIVDIVVKVGKPIQPIIINFLKSQKETEYFFARTCLTKMNISIDEISKEFAPTPMNQIIDFFFGKAKSPDKLWSDGKYKDDGYLGTTLKNAKAIGILEHIIIMLLNRFNFSTLFVDYSGKKGVDIVGLSNFGLSLIVAGVTSSNPHDDVQKLNNTVDEMKRTMPYFISRYNLIPVLFTKTQDIHSSDTDFIRGKKIVILTSKDIEELLVNSITGRTNQYLINFLLDKQQNMNYLPV